MAHTIATTARPGVFATARNLSEQFEIPGRVRLLQRTGMDAAQLATRFLLGYTFIFTGWGKLQHFDNTVAFFSDLGIPFASANAAFVASLEFVGGMMLLLGLGTRAVAFLLSSTMLVALLTAEGSTLLDALARENNVALSDVTPLVFLVFLGWLMATGPGRLSVDSRVARAFSIHR